MNISNHFGAKSQVIEWFLKYLYMLDPLKLLVGGRLGWWQTRWHNTEPSCRRNSHWEISERNRVNSVSVRADRVDVLQKRDLRLGILTCRQQEWSLWWNQILHRGQTDPGSAGWVTRWCFHGNTTNAFREKKKKMKALSKSHRYGDKEKRSDTGVEMGWGRGARWPGPIPTFRFV